MRGVFVTVGTTQFDELIESVLDIRCIHELKLRGCNRITFQIGNGGIIPVDRFINGIEISYFRFKDTIKDDLAAADFVISHAGAGSCLETLELQKPLLVVINESLMNNHQFEVAKKLSESKYLFYTTCNRLVEAIADIDLSKLRLYPKRDPRIYAKTIDCVMGFAT